MKDNTSFARSQIRMFKLENPPERSTITFAGTGPNTSTHVVHLSETGHEYLSKASRVNLVSGSMFSYLYYIGLQYDLINVENFLNFSHYIVESHDASIKKGLLHLLRRKRNESIFPNAMICRVMNYVFGRDFCKTTISGLNPNIYFISYCRSNKKQLAFNSRTHPNLTFEELARACVSVPLIYGAFLYKGHHLIDPLFSDDFRSIRKGLFNDNKPHLYLNHKTTYHAENKFYLKSEDKIFPEVELLLDFSKYYFGIRNRKIDRSNQEALNVVKNMTTDTSTTAKDRDQRQINELT